MEESFLPQKSRQGMPLGLPQRVAIPKTPEATSDMVENKITEKITKTASKSTCVDPHKSTQVTQPMEKLKEI